MITKGDLNSSLLIVTANLSKLDLFYKSPFEGLDGLFFDIIFKGLNIGYIGFEKENVINELAKFPNLERLIACGTKIKKTLDLGPYTYLPILFLHHPSYVLQRSHEEIEEYKQKIRNFI